MGADVPKASPASSNTPSQGLSPGHVKKPHSHTNKPKLKESSQTVSQTTKRSSTPGDDIVTQKAKKKKSDKPETNTTPKSVKEISVLNSGTESDPLKTKTIANSKKLKERRKSPDNSHLPSENSKTSNKSVKHKGKEIKIKKEKEKREKRSSPESGQDDQPKLQKFTIKRLAADAWSSTTSPPVTTNHNNNVIKEPLPTNAVSETVVNNKVTTTSKQNERVDAIFKEFAKDQSSDEEDGFTEEKHTNEKEVDLVVPKEEKQKSVSPVNSLNSKTSLSTSHVEGKAKKSKVHKSSTLDTVGQGSSNKKDRSTIDSLGQGSSNKKDHAVKDHKKHKQASTK